MNLPFMMTPHATHALTLLPSIAATMMLACFPIITQAASSVCGSWWPGCCLTSGHSHCAPCGSKGDTMSTHVACCNSIFNGQAATQQCRLDSNTVSAQSPTSLLTSV
ncbi:hypothetical protein BGW80DRAFT_1337806, partial [Lactifluus volemus]